MLTAKIKPHRIILLLTGLLVIALGVISFFIPPALFPDPGMGFQVLRCMQLGGPFNIFISPDQSDISQNYSEFLTWWSPGQYLVPYFIRLVAHISLGHAIAVTVTVCELSGLAGLYFLFKKLRFTPLVSTLSLLFIMGQQAFFVPFVFYNGGEILLFAFEGWFLYGCIAIKRPGPALILFVLLSGWAGFFLKSSFIWVYIAGLLFQLIGLSREQSKVSDWIKKGVYIALPALVSLSAIWFFFLSKGQSPASASNGLKFTTETFGFPLASPLLSAFSIDDLLHGLLFHTGTVLLSPQWSILLMILLALLSILLVAFITRYMSNTDYRLVLVVFYFIAIVFFGVSYLKQLTISYEARHFRLVGFLFVPGMIYLAGKFKRGLPALLVLICVGITVVSLHYLVKGFRINHKISAHGITGIAQPNVDQAALNTIMKLDKTNRNATFVFISNDTGLEILHNRIITLQPIGGDLTINTEDYRYEGHAGPLFIVLPETYAGPKEKLVLKSFPGYKGFNVSMFSASYVLYSAK